MPATTSHKANFESPVGRLHIEVNDHEVTAIHFAGDQLQKESLSDISDASSSTGISPLLRKVLRQLEEYFGGQRNSFDLPLAPAGTEFQQSVWEALRQIPFGQTCSYGDLARQLGDPNKVRAIGAANGRNPIPIIIPCHRVIGANKKLVGYAGGIERKRTLLQHEGAVLL